MNPLNRFPRLARLGPNGPPHDTGAFILFPGRADFGRKTTWKLEPQPEVTRSVGCSR